MDQLQTRLEALEQQLHTVNRRLRWWRGLVGGLLVLAVLTWALPSGTAQQTHQKKGLAERVAALEDLLQHFSREGNEVFITGANLHIVNGLDRTSCTDDVGNPIPDCPNGLGNLIVGYNETRGEDIRTGSHNIVVGIQHNFSSFGGLVVGEFHTLSGDFAVISGGQSNIASGSHSSVSGGEVNTASGAFSAVSGGLGNTASSDFTVVGGGASNTASGAFSVVSGGSSNAASGAAASVSGGRENTATGDFSSVSGGRNRTAEGDFDWVAGSLVEDE